MGCSLFLQVPQQTEWVAVMSSCSAAGLCGVVLTIGVARIVDKEFAFGLAQDGRCFRDLGQVGDLEQPEALSASKAAVGGGSVQPPAVTATRALSDDVHPITSVSVVFEHSCLYSRLQAPFVFSPIRVFVPATLLTWSRNKEAASAGLVTG